MPALTLLEFIVLIFGLLLALSVHESAHAWMANKLGDATAKMDGRISLNPFNHWDPVGTTLLVGLLMLRMVYPVGFIFGWGKPVPVNSSNLQDPRRDGLFIAFAGPLSNILLAILLAIIFRMGIVPDAYISSLILLVYLNILLAIFNMLPIPPLDGSTILEYILPPRLAQTILQNGMIMIVLLILMIYSFPQIITIPVSLLLDILLG